MPSRKGKLGREFREVRRVEREGRRATEAQGMVV